MIDSTDLATRIDLQGALRDQVGGQAAQTGQMGSNLRSSFGVARAMPTKSWSMASPSMTLAASWIFPTFRPMVLTGLSFSEGL